MNNYNELRNLYFKLELKGTNSIEENIWLKKLRNILESDIHKKPLGCKINETHMKIGKIHMESFYEAQILFSHPRWVNIFVNYLYEQIYGNCGERVLIVGYETYIEPVLFLLKERVDNKNQILDFCIYEEPKYIRSNETSNVRLRYSGKYIIPKKNSKQHLSNYDRVIFVCGISSTLNTFKKMNNYLVQEFELSNKSDMEKLEKAEFYSIIQVLPSNFEPESSGYVDDVKYEINEDEILKWNKTKKSMSKVSLHCGTGKPINVNFLISVESVWHNAKKCSLCFPKNYLEEKPIIETSETSVIPIQMIKLLDKGDDDNPKLTKTKIDFFESSKGRYNYKDYLYYNHIDRDNHHYKYYIRTGSLFNEILFNENSKKVFEKFCSEIKDEINKDNTKCVNIIISPAHFSDEMFPNAINNEVFDGNAHIISFDPKKEYRSNFETKYSNVAYFLEQLNINKDVKIKFHFVDDQLLTGSTFYRAKSLVTSLMEQNNYSKNDNKNDSESVVLFDSIIIMLNRISNSSKKDYINNTDKFFSLIDISVPSVRNYGNSCPACNNLALYEKLVVNSTLSTTAKNWQKKHYNYRVKSLEEAKRESKKLDDETKNRHMRRFDFENSLWKVMRHCNCQAEYEEEILNVIKYKSNLSCDDLIAVSKALANPFLYYMENEKKAALKFLLSIMNGIEDVGENLIDGKNDFNFRFYDENISIKKIDDKKIYNLLVVVLNCLSQIDSNFILNVDRIRNLCNNSCVKKHLGFGTIDDISFKFYTVLLNCYKRLICGIAGNIKCDKFRLELKQAINNCQYDDPIKVLFDAMYLESYVDITEQKTMENNSNLVEVKNTLVGLFNSYKKILLNSFDSSIQFNTQSSIVFYYHDVSMNENISYYELSETNSNFEGKTYIKVDIIDEAKENMLFNEENKDRLKHMGFVYIDKEEKGFLFDITYWDDQKIKELNENSYCKNLQRDMYLFVSLQNQDDLLEIARQMLSNRHRLVEKIDSDIRSGFVKSSIQAEKAGNTLSSDKAQSHGRSVDLTNLCGLVQEKFQNFTSLQNSRKEIYKAVEVLMNRIISYGATKQLYWEYYGKNVEEDLAISKGLAVNLNVKHYDIHPLEEQFKTFLIDINSAKGAYKDYLKEKRRAKGKTININLYENGKPLDLENIKLADFLSGLPCLLAVDKEKNTMWLIAILNVFILNAIKHAKVEKDNIVNIDINITVESRPLKMRDVYINKKKCIFTIINSFEDDSHNSDGGLTIPFVKYLKTITTEKGLSCEIDISMQPISNCTYQVQISLF